jgi:hypothetical protein
MFNKFTKASVAVGGLVATTAVALGVAAAPAQADANSELAYLQVLTSQGIKINNAAGAVQRGYQLCGLINTEGGASAARDFFYQAPSESGSLHAAQMMVNDAANTLCPWVWGNGAIPGAA